MDDTSSSVALQVLLNNATTLNFNALLVADEQEAQRVIPQLQAFNKSVPGDIMVFSLAGSLHLPGFQKSRRLSTPWTRWRRGLSRGSTKKPRARWALVWCAGI
jgi:hypothetical protein